MVVKAGRKKKIVDLLTLVVAVLLAGVIVGGALVWHQDLADRAGANALAGQLAGVNQKIVDTPAPPADLEVGLAAARAEMAAAEAVLPAVIERNDVVDYLISLADKHRVEAVPLVVEGWSPQSPGSPYNILKLNVTVTGRLAGVTDFISDLQDSEYLSLTVTGLSVNRLDIPGSSSGFGSATLVTAGMNIALYTYTPAAQGDVSS
jgi:hypothetical protein